jgi:5-methylthioadenosine/S-adenosylhomocysteine deaminase
MRRGLSMQRVHRQGTVLDARTMVDWATREDAAALGMADRVGSLEVGKRADIVLLDWSSPRLTPMIDGYGVLERTDP